MIEFHMRTSCASSGRRRAAKELIKAAIEVWLDGVADTEHEVI